MGSKGSTSDPRLLSLPLIHDPGPLALGPTVATVVAPGVSTSLCLGGGAPRLRR